MVKDFGGSVQKRSFRNNSLGVEDTEDVRVKKLG